MTTRANAVSRRSRTKSRAPAAPLISPQTRNALLALVATLALFGLGWWAWITFTTISPPDPASVGSDTVVDYLASPRGFARLPVDRREVYMEQVWEQFADDEARMDLHRSLRRLSPSERRVFIDAGVEVLKVRFLEQAREYNKLSPRQRPQFVGNVLGNLEAMRAQLTGAGTGGVNLGDPFQDDVPTGDALTKRIWSVTSPREREEGRRLLNDIIDHNQQQRRRR